MSNGLVLDWLTIAGLAVSLLTLLLVIFTIIWGTGLWARREKIEITNPRMHARLQTNEAAGIHFEYGFTLTYIKGSRDLYVSKIFIEFKKRFWKKLRPSFEIPISICKGGNQGVEARLPLGHPMQFGHDDFFPARRGTAKEELEELDNLVQRLWHRYKIGWMDTYGKTRWKTINQLRDIEKSFKEAM